MPRCYCKNNRIETVKLQNFCKKNVSIYYGSSRGDAEKSVGNAKYEIESANFHKKQEYLKVRKSKNIELNNNSKISN